jgi:hypothetical protein
MRNGMLLAILWVTWMVFSFMNGDDLGTFSIITAIMVAYFGLAKESDNGS